MNKFMLIMSMHPMERTYTAIPIMLCLFMSVAYAPTFGQLISMIATAGSCLLVIIWFVYWYISCEKELRLDENDDK